MENKKIIFLDIDGVLNASDYTCLLALSRRFEANKSGKKYNDEMDNKTRDKYGQLFDPRCCQWLKYIIDMTGADIVISSTWRHSGIQEMQAMWKKRLLSGNIVGITPNHNKIYNFYKDTKFERFRGVEIESYINQHAVKSFCIIDDDSDMLPHQMDNFCKTNADFGITMDVAERAIEILNKDE